MRAFKVVKVVAICVVAAVVMGSVVEHLWNWLMPGIFGLRSITFWQAIGLLLLCKLLFGGFHKHGPHKRRWSEEEKERFRAGMRFCKKEEE